MDNKRSAKGGRYIALNLCLNRRREDIATRKKRKNLFYKADTISSKAYAVRTIVHKTIGWTSNFLHLQMIVLLQIRGKDHH